MKKAGERDHEVMGGLGALDPRASDAELGVDDVERGGLLHLEPTIWTRRFSSAATMALSVLWNRRRAASASFQDRVTPISIWLCASRSPAWAWATFSRAARTFCERSTPEKRV